MNRNYREILHEIMEMLKKTKECIYLGSYCFFHKTNELAKTKNYTEQKPGIDKSVLKVTFQIKSTEVSKSLYSQSPQNDSTAEEAFLFLQILQDFLSLPLRFLGDNYGWPHKITPLSKGSYLPS